MLNLYTLIVLFQTVKFHLNRVSEATRVTMLFNNTDINRVNDRHNDSQIFASISSIFGIFQNKYLQNSEKA